MDGSKEKTVSNRSRENWNNLNEEDGGGKESPSNQLENRQEMHAFDANEVTRV